MSFIDIKKLSFEYFRRDAEGNVEEIIDALKDVSLDVKQGDFVAILGRNGSGKSTLAKHINALLLPGEGEVIVDGIDTREEEMRLSVRKTAGMVFQNPDNQIVANLVEEDVAFGPENVGIPTAEIWNLVDESLSLVGMNEKRHLSPNHLSGGQKQRVAIAGVLAMEPKCIIFDEATAMLDPQGRAQIIEVAKKLQNEKNITIILITHHMDEVLAADKVYLMNRGNVVGQGTPMEIFSKQELLEECGLSLPPLYQYMNFLKSENMLEEGKESEICSRNELASYLIKRYSPSQSNIMGGMQDKRNQDVKTNSHSVAEGIYLNGVRYIYNKGYADEKLALRDIELSIGKGEFVAVIGHTGSGKSTLMQHFNGLCKPTEGSVFFDGQDIWDQDYSKKELRQKVGLVFQYPEHQLFADTVEMDVSFGPKNMKLSQLEVQKRAYDAIAAVGLPDTIYDASPFQLSGGQKRRVAIAGILAMEPDYLVLDEPTAGLDPKSAKDLLEMLRLLQTEKGITIVIVSHSMEEVSEYADRIVVMNEGEKIFDDAAGEVFSHVEELEAVGLDVPFGVALLHELKHAGFAVDDKCCRQFDICGELAKLR